MVSTAPAKPPDTPAVFTHHGTGAMPHVCSGVTLGSMLYGPPPLIGTW